MTKETYIGINNLSQKIKYVYVGINNIARTVKNAYIGINNVARECYTNGIPVSIPTMTSNTAPSGRASTSSNYNSRSPWHVFDKNSSTFWTQSTQNQTGQWVQYDFEYSIQPTQVTVQTRGEGAAKTISFRGSVDGSTWDTLCSISCPSSTAVTSVNIDTTNRYRYFRWVCTAYYSGGWARISEANVYGIKY